jgi:hypothetical protein
MALFDKKIPDKHPEVIPAQDIARREARAAKSLCQVIGSIH